MSSAIDKLAYVQLGFSQFCVHKKQTKLSDEVSFRTSEVMFSHLRYGFRIGSFVVVEEHTQSLPFVKHHVCRCIGMWLSYALLHLSCEGLSATL